MGWSLRFLALGALWREGGGGFGSSSRQCIFFNFSVWGKSEKGKKGGNGVYVNKTMGSGVGAVPGDRIP